MPDKLGLWNFFAIFRMHMLAHACNLGSILQDNCMDLQSNSNSSPWKIDII